MLRSGGINGMDLVLLYAEVMESYHRRTMLGYVYHRGLVRPCILRGRERLEAHQLRFVHVEEDRESQMRQLWSMIARFLRMSGIFI